MKHRPWRRERFQITSLLAVVALLMIVFLTSAWFFFTASPPVPEETARAIAQLHAQKEIWNNAKPASYRYVVERDCACALTFTTPYLAFEDRGAKSVRFSDLDLARFDDDIAVPDDPVWIDDLFASIERSFERGDALTVRYDPRYGFPTFVGRVTEESSDEFRISVRDFEVLEYD